MSGFSSKAAGRSWVLGRGAEGFAQLESSDGESLVLTSVASPFTQLRKDGLNLGDLSPVELGQKIDEAVARAKESVAGATDGIAYFLTGAQANESTPMFYGGNFLDADRDVMTDAKGVVALVVTGGDMAFYDCVSDLPHDFLVVEPITTAKYTALRAMGLTLVARTGNPTIDVDPNLFGQFKAVASC